MTKCMECIKRWAAYSYRKALLVNLLKSFMDCTRVSEVSLFFHLDDRFREQLQALLVVGPHLITVGTSDSILVVYTKVAEQHRG